MLDIRLIRRHVALGMALLALVIGACTPGASPSRAPASPSESGMMEHPSASPS
jgi:hypothetical protein